MRRLSPAQRRKKSERPKAFALLFCRDAVSQTKLAPPLRVSPFSGGTGPLPTPRKRAVGGPKRFSPPPAGGTTYCFGGRGLNSVPAPAVLCRDAIPRTGAAPTRGALPFSGGTGPLPTPRKRAVAAPNDSLLPRQTGRPTVSAGAASTRFPHQLFSAGTPSLALGQRRLVGPPLLGGTGSSSPPQRGAIGGPKRFPFPPAGGTTYCFGGRGLNSALAPTGRGRVTPLFPNRRSRRSPGRKTGYHTAPGGGWRVTKGGMPLHQGVDLLQCTTSPSNLPDRQQRAQSFFSS